MGANRLKKQPTNRAELRIKRITKIIKKMSIFSSKFLEEYNKVKLDDLKKWVINNHYLNHDLKAFNNEQKILDKCLNLSELRHNILFFGGTQNLNDFHRDFMNCLMEGFEYNNKNKEERKVKKKTVKIKGEIE